MTMKTPLAGLNHPEGALRPDDFVIIKANWENKDRNIAETAAELNILPDSIVFADDNPAEREIVRHADQGRGRSGHGRRGKLHHDDWTAAASLK